MILLFFFLGAVVFGGISYRLRWLSLGGSFTASSFGFCLLWLGGWPWVIPLILFFGTSSILSKIGNKSSNSSDSVSQRDDIRNAIQVLANGGVAWLMLILFAISSDTFWYAGFIGSLAAATADTWATEIGRLAGGQPRHIVNGRILDKGLSGGITWQGTGGSLVGAVLIGLSCVPFYDNEVGHCIILGIAGGMTGSLLDSLFGATLQAKFRHEQSGVIHEERNLEIDFVKVSGFKWVTNDLVNVFCTPLWWIGWFTP